MNATLASFAFFPRSQCVAALFFFRLTGAWWRRRDVPGAVSQRSRPSPRAAERSGVETWHQGVGSYLCRVYLLRLLFRWSSGRACIRLAHPAKCIPGCAVYRGYHRSWLLVNCDVEHTGARSQGAQPKRYSASDFSTNSQAVSHLKTTTRRTDDQDTAPGPALIP